MVAGEEAVAGGEEVPLDISRGVILKKTQLFSKEKRPWTHRNDVKRGFNT